MKCNSEHVQRMDDGFFTQNISMKEWFELVRYESSIVKRKRNQSYSEHIIKLINGQFFGLMKLLNEKKTNYKCPNRLQPCRKTKRNSHLAVSYILEAPYPNQLIY